MNLYQSPTSINSHHQSWIIIHHQHQSTIIINHEQSSSNNHQLLSIININHHSTSTINIDHQKKRDTKSRRNRPHQTSSPSLLRREHTVYLASLPSLDTHTRVLKNACVSELACSFCVACKSVWSDSTHTRITQTREWGRCVQFCHTEQFVSTKKRTLGLTKELKQTWQVGSRLKFIQIWTLNFMSQIFGFF